MADYSALSGGSRVVSLTAASSVAGGDILEVAASGSVRRCTTAASMSYVGCAADDAPAGGRVTVFGRGWIHESVAEGTVTAGDQLVTSTATGRQVKTLAAAGSNNPADINLARAIFGIALTTAADGAKVRWTEF